MKPYYLKQFLFLLAISVVSGMIGYGANASQQFKHGYESGFVRGKLDLALDITNEIGLKISSGKFDKNSYKLLFGYMDSSFYICQGKVIKTIASY